MIKLLSLNVEQDKHLLTVRHFVEQEKADIVALMEVCEDNLDTLLAQYAHRLFAPNFALDSRRVGVVIASRSPLSHQEIFYADGIGGVDVPPHGKGTHRPVTVIAYSAGITWAATHFTWTPDMTETPRQHEHLDTLLDQLEGKDMVMCGDYNIPRGNGAYQKLAARYHDAIPAEVVSTIDPAIHRANTTRYGTLQVVVDYVWTTQTYKAENVHVVDGVSDHCGVVAEIDIV